MSRSYQRPENALKRANEFIDVGKPSRALEVLYEVIRRGKMRTNCSEKLLEPIMFKYLELCVDLKKSHLAKEGLYQYRNIFQSVNVSSLETVVKFYLRLADERTESARKESHQAVIDIDDLDNLATPEEILLSAVSGEDAQDRSDRTILTPWVKFLWESYRQCLELLRTNSRVEKLYHNIAQHAFKFCEKYTRKMEFRKLCDNLRLHLSLIQKQQGSAAAVNLNNPETQQLNLETRLEQLNCSIKMELWQEAYKAIEDISDLMKKSKKMTRPHVMASYYDKLSLVFWKAGNYLFHAATLFKLFQLLRDQKKNITAEELSRRASVVLVSTLAIPLPSDHPEFDRFIETEKSALEKVDRLANLLSLSKPPTRNSLIRDLNRLNVINSVPTELQDMFNLMEMEFDPLHLCKRMQVYLDWINGHPELGLPQYVPALQEITIMRLVKQVGQVYQSITYKRLLELSLFLSHFHLEKILVELVRHNDLQIRIDHRTNCVHFGVDLSESQREDLPEGPMLQSLPSETIRCQLVHMSSAMQKCLELISPERKKREMEPVRAQTIHLYNQTRAQEHEKLLARQNIIEERKEMLENQNQEREEQLRRAQEEELKRQKEEEQDRLRREAHKRERERQEEQLKQIHTKQIKDKLMQISRTSYGQKMIEKIDKEELLTLGADEILQRQVEELEKERKEQQKKLKAQEKSIDFFERARRLLEIPRLKKQLEAQKEKDMEFWKVQEEERIAKLVKEHEIALVHSKRLQVMTTDRQDFMARLKAARHSEIEKKLNDFNDRVEVERRKRLQQRKEQRRQERRDAYYKQKQEEEQLRRDEETKRLKEEEARREVERLQQAEVEEDEREARRRAGAAETSSGERRANDPVSTLNGEVGQGTPEPWRPKKASIWKQRVEEKENSWRLNPSPKGDAREPLSERLASKDIRQEKNVSFRADEQREDWRGDRGSNDMDSGGRKPDRDIERRPPASRDGEFTRNERDSFRDGDRDKGGGGFRDFGRGTPRNRDFERGPPKDRDFERGPRRDADFERGPRRDADFERGPRRDADFERGPRRDADFERGPRRDADFERGPRRDADFERGPRRDADFERGPRRDADFERGPRRDADFERGPRRDRDFERGPRRDTDFERGPTKDRDFGKSTPRDSYSDYTRGAPRDKKGFDDYRKDGRFDTPRRGYGSGSGGGSWRGGGGDGDDSGDNWRSRGGGGSESSERFEKPSPKGGRPAPPDDNRTRGPPANRPHKPDGDRGNPADAGGWQTVGNKR